VYEAEEGEGGDEGYERIGQYCLEENIVRKVSIVRKVCIVRLWRIPNYSNLLRVDACVVSDSLVY